MAPSAEIQRRPTVLITGASGFLGRHLVRFLSDNGLVVRAAARDTAGINCSSSVAAVQIPDLMHAANLQPLLAGVDQVIHLAGIAHRKASDEEHEQVNHRATLALVNAAKQEGVRHFVFVSSIGAQSGPSSDVILDETSVPKPTTPYGRAKLAAENSVRESGISFTILRPTVVYGEGAKGNFSTIVKIARLPVPLPFGSLSNRRSLLSIDNFGAAVLTVLENPAALNEIFVVADPTPVTIGEIITDIRRGMNRRPLLFPVPPVLLKFMLGMAGKRTLWERLAGSLIVNPAKLLGLGWNPSLSKNMIKGG